MNDSWRKALVGTTPHTVKAHATRSTSVMFINRTGNISQESPTAALPHSWVTDVLAQATGDAWLPWSISSPLVQ